MKKYIQSTEIVDSEHVAIVACARALTFEYEEFDDISMAVKFYYFVRDKILYDPYTHFHKSQYYKASRILSVKRGNCICKASLLCALARSVKIPARFGFADVRNHLSTKQLIEFMGTETFLFHGYTELFLQGRWVIATPAFNAALCTRHGVEPLKFDGWHDSIFQSYNSRDLKYMEYVNYHGSFYDIPLKTILSAWRKGYGKSRVDGWVREIENNNPLTKLDFYNEDLH